MSSDLIPYLLLALAVPPALWRMPRTSLAFVALASVAGLAFDRVEALGIVWAALLGLSLWLAARTASPINFRVVGYVVFGALALLLSNHLMPGFRNFLVYDEARFSVDTLPFAMFLNFDKTLVGIFICLFFLKPARLDRLRREDWLSLLKILAVLVACLMPVALAIGYVRIDIKLPEGAWLWAFNNLAFVCFAEEALFRGFIQGGVVALLPKRESSKWIALAVGAALFGLAHFRGGIAYVALATIAGIFYGLAYKKTGKIEAPILVHFGLNLIHFLFFSYPALDPVLR